MPATAKTTVAHFTVTGEALTELARGLMLSETPSKAWRFLAQNLSGGSESMEKAAIEILEGRKKLVGDSTSGIEIRPDRAKSYRKTLQFIYAGRVKIRGAWYRPAAEVKHFSPWDAKEASKGIPENVDPDDAPGVIRDWWRRRASLYSTTGEILIEIGTNPVRFFLFEPTGEAPFWRTENTDPGAALVESLSAGRRLQELQSLDPEDEDSWDGAWKARRKEEIEAEEEAEEEALQARLAEYGAKVREQAGSDTFELVTESGEKFVVPRVPFVRWALSRTHLWAMAPAWKEVSPSGLKMQMDNPDHTDWMLGAGIDLDRSYNDEVMDAAGEERAKIQREYGDYKFAVLVAGPSCEGVVGKDIVLLRDLRNSPENNLAISKARGIVAERGGELAHVAIVAREMKIPVFLVPDATSRFREGQKLALEPDCGQIYIRGYE